MIKKVWVANDEFKKSTRKYPKKKWLERLANWLKETDNKVDNGEI